MKQDKIRQVGNCQKPRKNFANPEEGRTYSPIGISPTLKGDLEKHPKLMLVLCARKSNAGNGKA